MGIMLRAVVSASRITLPAVDGVWFTTSEVVLDESDSTFATIPVTSPIAFASAGGVDHDLDPVSRTS